MNRDGDPNEALGHSAPQQQRRLPSSNQRPARDLATQLLSERTKNKEVSLAYQIVEANSPKAGRNCCLPGTEACGTGLHGTATLKISPKCKRAAALKIVSDFNNFTRIN